MTYHILTQMGSVVSHSTVQRVTNLEQQEKDTDEAFVQFDADIHRCLKCEDRGYEGSKPNPSDWTDLMEEDPDFKEEFQRIFDNPSFPEADEFTPSVLEDTYVDKELNLPRDGEEPSFARVTKRLCDANGITIGTASDNQILDTQVYEFEYMDGRDCNGLTITNYVTRGIDCNPTQMSIL